MTINQPAGHLESGESLIEAVIRETQEETAYTFEPNALVGIYRWMHPQSGETYMRFCFTGDVVKHDANQALDADIHQALWLDYSSITDRKSDCRGPLVMDCFKDYLAGQRYPLTLLKN
jgi:8-oxo-dGTP pyrophosphatase MutT (NUDIX family)